MSLVRSADSRWVFPVLYSMAVPGSATSGCRQTYRTQLGLWTQAP
ncbi:MAG: hypothetical protein R2712_05585 [Vicinamibacterales bacterium]